MALTDDGYVIQDNFYRYVLGPEYSEMLTEKFAEAGLENFVVHTRMSGYVDDEVYSGMSMEDFIRKTKNHDLNVYVYIDMPGDNARDNYKVLQKIEEQLRSVGNQGYHRVFFVCGVTSHCSTWKEGFEYSREHNGVELEIDIH